MNAQKILNELGFSSKEISVYIALLKNGKSTPATLARLTRLNRPTVYNILKGLQSHGVIAEDVGNKTLHFLPLPLESLNGIIEQQKRDIKNKEDSIKKAIGELSLLTAGKSSPIPKIRFVDENNLEKFLYENIEKWQKTSIQDDVAVWGFQDEGFATNFSKWIEYGWKTKLSKNTKYRVRHLTNASDFEYGMEGKHSEGKRQVKFVDGVDFTSTIWVAGDYLVMVVTKEQPFYLFEIFDKTLAHNMREVIKRLWNSPVSK